MKYHETQHQQGVTPPEPGPLREAPSSLLAGVLSRLKQSERYIAAQRSRQALLNALEHPQWEIRAAAVQAIEKLGPQAALDPLLGVLQDEHRLVRAAAVHALGSLAEQTPEQQIPVEQVLLVLRDEAWEVREMAVLVLGKLPFSLAEPLLQEALQDSNSCVREAARFALERHEEVSPHANDEGQRYYKLKPLG
jgi:HEAT repeat protein